MPKYIRFTIVLLALSAVKGFTGPADVPILFTNSAVTGVGTSLFIVGSIPQLGNWQTVRSIKLVASNCVGPSCLWFANIGIPEGASYQYKFIQRADCARCYGSSLNISPLPSPTNSDSVAAGPPAPFAGKTVFYYSSWSTVSLLYSNTSFGWTNLTMLAVGPGRTNLFPDEQIWRADGINSAGDTNLQFAFFTVIAGTNVYDNAGQPSANYQTPLDACVVQDGQVYNYWPPPSVSPDRVETFFLSSTNLAGRIIRVYLPRGYDENTTKRYPILYMHDGQNVFINSYAGCCGCWYADTNANNLIRFAKMRETIIVGVDNTSARLQEYTPPGCSPPGGGVALGDKYAALLVYELKPYIDSHYRTLTDAENTGVLGSSMGGLISAWLGWQGSDTAHRIGAMSSSFWVCYPIPSPDTKRPIRIYLDSGDLDDQGVVGSSDGLLDTVAERDNLINDGYVFNIDLDHQIGYNHWHNEQWWNRRSPRCFTFLFPTSDEPNTVLDTVAPPRIASLQATDASNVLTWTSYRLRTYTVQGITNESLSSSIIWSNLYTTPTPEPRFWDYPSLGVTNSFRFLRVRENAVPDWPN
ncbi:MAG TPA: alpha/beta hydrolase-fold protein [Verrucomicrobiae bacterium]|nr:alpha/beta hydrolase-fold protein [Verrucomicrobiae bacterium]